MLLPTLLFTTLAQAATVFLNPPESLPSHLSPQQANLVLAAHLGLEQFEVVDQPGRLNHLFREHDFVGQGFQSALLLLVDEAHARDIVPSSLTPSFSFFEPSPEFLTGLLKTSTQRAMHVYNHVASKPVVPSHGFPRTLDLFALPTPANEAFLAEASTLFNYVDATGERFAALELTSIPMIAAEKGTTSEAYEVATKMVRAVVEAVADQSVGLAVVAYAPGTQQKGRLLANGGVSGVRATSAPPKIYSSTSCYGSFLTCTDAMNGCSGHGQCTNATRAGQECFVCACTSTVSETGKVQHWAGEMCERKDVSGPFVLITGTVITLILLMGGSISLLYAVSTHELPSILTGGVAGGARKE